MKSLGGNAQPATIDHGYNATPGRSGSGINSLSSPGYRRKPPRFPIGARLLDAFLARGHEIPPDVARPIHRRAAEEHETRRVRGFESNAIARPEDEQQARLEALTPDVDGAGYGVNRALLVVGIERQRSAGCQVGVCVKNAAERSYRRCLSVERARNEAHGLVGILYNRQ